MIESGGILSRYVRIEAWGARGQQVRSHRGIESRGETYGPGNARQTAASLCRDYGLNGYWDTTVKPPEFVSDIGPRGKT